MLVLERPGEDGEEAGVLSVVVGAVAEKFGEFSEGVALVIGDDGAEAGGAGVAAGAAIAVGVDPVGLGGGGELVEERHSVQFSGFRGGRAARKVRVPSVMTFPLRPCLYE